MDRASETSDNVPELEDEVRDRGQQSYWGPGERGRGLSHQGVRGGTAASTGTSGITTTNSSAGNNHSDGRDILSPAQQDKPGATANLGVKLTHGVVACSLVGIVFIILIASSLPFYLFLVWQFAPSVVKTTQPLYFDYRLQSPAATVPLLPEDKIAASQAAKSPTYGPRVIPVGQKVNVWVNLKLPDSYTNRQLGVFQVTVQLLSSRGDVLAQSTQPSIMRFRSLPVRLVRATLLIMPLVCGLVDDDQDIKLHVIKGYMEREVPVAMIRVTLDARAGMPLKQGLPEVYGADLIVDTAPRGIRAFIHRWKLTSFVWGAFGLLFVEIFVLLRCCRWALVPKIWSKRAEKQETALPTARVTAEPMPRASTTPSMYERLSSDNEEGRDGDVGQEVSSESEFEYDDELAKMLFEQRLLHDMDSRERERPTPQAASMHDTAGVSRHEGEEVQEEEHGGEEERDEDEEDEDEDEEVPLHGDRWVKVRRGSSLRTGQLVPEVQGGRDSGLSEGGRETKQVISDGPHEEPMDDAGGSSGGSVVEVMEGLDESGVISSRASEGSSSGNPYTIQEVTDCLLQQKGKEVTSNNEEEEDAQMAGEERERLYHLYEEEPIHEVLTLPAEQVKSVAEWDRMYTSSRLEEQSAVQHSEGAYNEPFVSASASQGSETGSEDVDQSSTRDTGLANVTEEGSDMDNNDHPERFSQRGLRRRRM